MEEIKSDTIHLQDNIEKIEVQIRENLQRKYELAERIT
jgi:hypothetical protein